MRDLLQQIDLGLKADLYYLSLFAALSIPDICAALSSTDGQTNRAKYIAWFDQHVAPKFRGTLDGRTCYQFRCSLLHEGSTQHERSQYSRILFLEPQSNSNIFHNNVIGDALNIDVRMFCYDIINSAENWLAANESSPIFQANFPKYIHRYPNGIPPYIVGTPVIG